MLFLSDILAKRKKRLDLSKKPIAFVEEKTDFKLKKNQKNKLVPYFELNLNQEEFLYSDFKLLPGVFQPTKFSDLYLKRKKTNGLESLYRLMLVSPQQSMIRQELFRFSVIGLVVILFLNIMGAYTAGMSMKKNLEAKALGAYSEVMNATDSAQKIDFQGMFTAFLDANTELTEAEQILFQKLKLNSEVNLATPLQSATLLLKAGNHLTKAGQYLAKTVYNFKNWPLYFAEGGQNSNQLEQPNLRLTDRIKADSGYLNLALTEIENAETYLAGVNIQYLPEDFQIKIVALEKQLYTVKNLISSIQTYLPFLLDLLGDRYPQRYMILLQNNHEIRATGGFIGSYILMDLNDGVIEKFELKDVYETDGQFHAKLDPPPGLHKITEDWKMRDGNYSPDFPTSARQIMWFLEQEKGPTVDAVIAVNQRIVEKLLDKMGGVELKDLGLILTGENFSWIFSYLIEAKFSETNTPKQFLIDFIPDFKEELLKTENIPALLDVLQESIRQKDLMVYASDPKFNTLIQKFGLDGKIAQIDQSFDYLQVVNTSIGGNKSDGFIDQKIEHKTLIDADGKITDDLTVTRKHTWYHVEDALFDKLFDQFGSGKLERQELKDILGFGGNKNLMRVYVPWGSKLISATGSVSTEEVTVYNDLGRTVFAFEQPPVYTERESKINLVYLLPYQLDLKYADNYRFLIQNQPGQEENYFLKSVDLNREIEVLDKYPQAFLKGTQQNLTFDEFLEGDEYLSVIVREK